MLRRWMGGGTGPIGVRTSPQTLTRLLGSPSARAVLADPPGVEVIELGGVRLNLTLSGHRALWALAVARLDPSWPATADGSATIVGPRATPAVHEQPQPDLDRATGQGRVDHGVELHGGDTRS
ncbi:hypothetical protein ACOCJ4_05790 [Knoellia sp. CPCC 206435]|uniref:hypothetical protein n=1 Tax=Knoellia terrae TaxID=3404797 RepID=UPI003B437F3D